MRAALLHNTGDEKLEIVDDVEVDAPGPGEVTIKIEATGVCHSDLHAMQGSLPQPAPFVPGHEGAGIISAVGEGVTALAERAAHRPGVGDLLQDRRAGRALVQAQAFGLSEKKPADSGSRSLRVPTIRPRRRASGRCGGCTAPPTTAIPSV